MHTVHSPFQSTFYSNLIYAFVVLLLLAGPLYGIEIPPDVASIFTDNCTHCHGGLEPESDLNLEQPAIFAETIGRPSSQQSQLFIIKPGDPEQSYLVRKITGNSDITGRRMPPFGTLSSEHIEAITGWIASLDPNQSYNQDTDRNSWAFLGLTIGNTPTTEVLPSRTWYFRISHRFESAIKEGYQSFYGFDGPAVMMVTFGISVDENLIMSLGRTNAGDALEWSARYRIYNEEQSGIPFSLALQTTLGWETEDKTDRDRYSADAVSYTFQVPITRHLSRTSVIALTPGILVNPNTNISDEDLLIVIGIAAKHELGKGYSLIGDWSPIVSGFSSLRTTYGFYNEFRRYDSWTFGLEKITVSHVFQLFVTNAEGIVAAQSLNGGDLKLQNGDMRLGFEIYRLFGW